MFIHPEISRELAQDRQREMLAHAQHRRLKNMPAADLAPAAQPGPPVASRHRPNGTDLP